MELKRFLQGRVARGLVMDVACIAYLGLLVAIAFADVLGSDRGLFFRDHRMVFRRRWQYIANCFHTYTFPSFDRFDPAGVPFEALLNATFVPTSLIFLLGDFDVVYDLHVALIVWVLGVGAFGCARQLGAARSEALMAGAVAMLVGPVLSFENLLVGLQGLAYAPWMYWALAALLQKPTLRRTALFSIACGFHVQGLMPETLLLDALVAIGLMVHLRPKITRRLILSLGSGAVLGLTIAAVELVPVLLFLPGTRRGHGFDYETMSQWSLRGEELLHFIVPSLWYQPEVALTKDAAFGLDGMPYLVSIYFGSVISLCLLALKSQAQPFTRSGLRVWALLMVVSTGIVLALGPATPFHPWLQWIPILKSGRFPVKYLLLTVPATAALAALGFRTAMRAQGGMRTLAYTAGIQTLGLGGLWWAISSSSCHQYLNLILSTRADFRFIDTPLASYGTIAQSAMSARTEHAFIFSASLTLAALLATFPSRLRPVLGALVFALPGVDLAFAGQLAIAGAPIEPNSAPAPLAALVSNRPERVYTLAPNHREPMLAHAPGQTYFEAQILSRRMRGMFWPQTRYLYDLDTDGQSNPIYSRMFHALLPSLKQVRARRLLGRYGVGWITSPLYEPSSLIKRIEIPGESPQFFMRNDDLHPYLHAYTHWRNLQLADGPSALAHALTDENSQNVAVVYNSKTEPRPHETCGEATTTLDTDLKDTRIGAQIDSPCPCIAVLLETLMPGWTARVDGQAQAVVNTEVGMLGAFMPAGRHHIEFTYESRAQAWAPVSTLALILALFLCTVGL